MLPMSMVHLAPPLLSALAGVVGLLAVNGVAALSAAGWITGSAYLVVSGGLLARGLRRAEAESFGWANAVTAARSTLTALVTALVATSFTDPIPRALVVALAAIALILDAVDGWLARRTRTETALGARFDMEVDAFLLLALSAYVAQDLGWWVLTIGLLRYAFVAAGWALPWMRATLPPRYWRKVVTAVAGIALVVAASALLPEVVNLAIILFALALLLESFGRDVVWLLVRRGTARSPASGVHPTEARTTT